MVRPSGQATSKPAFRRPGFSGGGIVTISSRLHSTSPPHIVISVGTPSKLASNGSIMLIAEGGRCESALTRRWTTL